MMEKFRLGSLAPDSPVPANPFLRIRRNVGLSQVEFARALGVGTATVEQAEQGIPLTPRSMILAMVKLGCEPSELLRQYIAWREQRGAHARQDLIQPEGVGSSFRGAA